MIRTLFVIAGAALVLSVAALAGAFALGGRDLARDGWAWTVRGDDGETVRLERVRPDEVDRHGPVVVRDLAWSGGDALVLGFGADVDYVQGVPAGVRIEGPQRIVERIRLEAGRFTLAPGDEQVVVGWDRNGLRARSDRDRLRIVVTAPDVARFEVAGSGDLEVRDYDRPDLDLILSGSGDARVRGRTQRLTLAVSGSGEAELDDLAVTDATVTISGSGDASVAASGVVDARISGSGELDLVRRPSRLNSQVTGSGRVRGD